jgi:hypothetical protein
MITVPFAGSLARDGVAQGLVGARATDPVLVDRPAARPPRAPRTRNRLAVLLRRAADAVAPAEYSPAR